MSACPTTSVADRKRIYDTRCNTSHNSQGGSGASNTSGGRGGGRSEVMGGSTSGSATPASGTSTTPASGSGTASSASANTTVAISSTQDEQRVTYVNAMDSTQPLPIVTYEDHLTLNSGAIGHMHSRCKGLTDIVAFIPDVILPDGADIKVTETGILRVSCLDLLTRLRQTIPLLNTLHVLGLRTTLWSVIQIAQCGHTIISGYTTIRIILHDDRPELLELRLSRPFYQRRDHPFDYCVTTPAFANCVITADSVIGAAAPTAAKEGKTIVVRARKLVTVELLHKRLGHVSTKAILAANEAGVWEDVTVRFPPSSFCIDCKVGTSRTSNRG